MSRESYLFFGMLLEYREYGSMIGATIGEDSCVCGLEGSGVHDVIVSIFERPITGGPIPCIAGAIKGCECAFHVMGFAQPSKGFAMSVFVEVAEHDGMLCGWLVAEVCL